MRSAIAFMASTVAATAPPLSSAMEVAWRAILLHLAAVRRVLRDEAVISSRLAPVSSTEAPARSYRAESISEAAETSREAVISVSAPTRRLPTTGAQFLDHVGGKNGPGGPARRGAAGSTDSSPAAIASAHLGRFAQVPDHTLERLQQAADLVLRARVKVASTSPWVIRSAAATASATGLVIMRTRLIERNTNSRMPTKPVTPISEMISVAAALLSTGLGEAGPSCLPRRGCASFRPPRVRVQLALHGLQGHRETLARLTTDHAHRRGTGELVVRDEAGFEGRQLALVDRGVVAAASEDRDEVVPQLVDSASMSASWAEAASWRPRWIPASVSTMSRVASEAGSPRSRCSP